MLRLPQDLWRLGLFFRRWLFFPQQLKALGVSAQIGSGVVRCVPQVRFHKGSIRVP